MFGDSRVLPLGSTFYIDFLVCPNLHEGNLGQPFLKRDAEKSNLEYQHNVFYLKICLCASLMVKDHFLAQLQK